MWYESEMINETLDSLYESIKHSTEEINLRFCLNSQTYLETPIEGLPEDMFVKFIDHKVLKNAEIIYKTDKDPFYNIGDWRREQYNPNAKYTIWGESDCLVPEDYFYILSSLDILEPHILSLSSRIMWDNTWTIVEHKALQKYPNLDNQKPSYEELSPYRYYDYININQLSEFNSKLDIEIIKLHNTKVDGSLLALSCDLPNPFIAENMHFIREDTCAELFFQKKGIPQYHISTRIKGHNYHHPLKRTNTLSKRGDSVYIEMARLSKDSMIKFIINA
jgi:hypothetical protein